MLGSRVLQLSSKPVELPVCHGRKHELLLACQPCPKKHTRILMSRLIESASGDLAADDHQGLSLSLYGASLTWPQGSAPAPTAPPAGMRERLRDGRVRAQDRGACEEEIRGRIFGRISRSAALWLHKPRCSAAAYSSSTHVRFQLFLGLVQFAKIFKIFRHIESLIVCIEH